MPSSPVPAQCVAFAIHGTHATVFSSSSNISANAEGKSHHQGPDLDRHLQHSPSFETITFPSLRTLSSRLVRFHPSHHRFPIDSNLVSRPAEQASKGEAHLAISTMSSSRIARKSATVARGSLISPLGGVDIGPSPNRSPTASIPHSIEIFGCIA